MPDRLDEALVESSLQALPHWSGGTAGIHRTVQATGAQADELVRLLAESAEAMGHQPQVVRTGTEVQIVLGTTSEGGVTSLDIAMASLIEDMVAQATGVPAEHIHHTPLDDPSGTDEVDK